MRLKREALDNIGPSAENYHLFTDFELRFFTSIFKVYSQTKVARLQWDKFICTKRETNNIVNSLVGKKKSLDFYGNGKVAACSPIRGYIRTPLTGLAKKLSEHESCTLFQTDEFRSTKLCSICYLPLKTSKSPHRYQVVLCKVTLNISINGCHNLFIALFEMQNQLHEKKFTRQTRVFCAKRNESLSEAEKLL